MTPRPKTPAQGGTRSLRRPETVQAAHAEGGRSGLGDRERAQGSPLRQHRGAPAPRWDVPSSGPQVQPVAAWLGDHGADWSQQAAPPGRPGDTQRLTPVPAEPPAGCPAALPLQRPGCLEAPLAEPEGSVNIREGTRCRGDGASGGPLRAWALESTGPTEPAAACPGGGGGSGSQERALSGGGLALHQLRPRSRTAGPAAGPGSVRRTRWTDRSRQTCWPAGAQSPYLQYSFLNSLSKSMCLAGRGH